jgi:hypothetical protein
MNNDLFWDNLLKTAYTNSEALDFAGGYLTASDREEEEHLAQVRLGVEQRMSGKSQASGAFTSVRGLTDDAREKLALKLPVEVGTRVAFIANAGSVLAYDDMPEPEMEGVVVAVKTASGDVTSYDGKVFVRWADGLLRGIYAEHLRQASGTTRRSAAVNPPGRQKVASLGDLTDFLRIASDQLVHKATKDLWSLKRDREGFVIERLFDDNGSPLKV